MLLSSLALLTGAITVTNPPLAAAAPAHPATAGAQGSACTTNLPAADAALTERPVVLVHGWNSNAAAMEGLAKLISKGTQHYFLYCFDYSHLTSKWPKDPSIHQQLANEIVALSKAYTRGGGDGKVLAVGHSMGGIAIRYASQDTFAGVKVGDILAGVVTLGTPHIGSPWGGAGVARTLEVAAAKYNGDRLFPPANSDAAACLATLSRRPESCGQIPYLPAGVPLTELGTQIFVHRTLFNIGFVKGPSADIALFGDGLVPQDSSTGYIGSGPQVNGSRRIPYRATVTPDVATCTYDTDYLLAAKAGAKVAGSGPWAVAGALAGVLGNEILDSHAADRLLQGKASPFLVQLTTYAATTPCFHTNLTTLPKLADATITALATDATTDIKKSDALRFRAGGRETGRVVFDHPAWGTVTLMTALSHKLNDLDVGHIFVVDASGRLRWQHDLTGQYELGLNEPTRDSSGHIFLNYNPGRYNGVIVLEPTETGFEDFGTLPPRQDNTGRFYSAQALDADNDGVFEVLVSSNDCQPDCAGGSITKTLFRWNGSDYALSAT